MPTSSTRSSRTCHGPDRRGSPAAPEARGRQAADRRRDDGSRPRRSAEHEHDPFRGAADHRDERRPDRRHRRPQGPRRDAPRPGPARGPLRGLRRAADVRRRPAPRPARHRRLPRRHLRPRRPRLQPFVSTLVQRPTVVAAAADQAERGHGGHPRQPVHLRAEPGGRARAAPAALRRDAPVPGRPRERPPASSRARWSR